MTSLFRVGFEGEAHEITMVAEGRYMVETREDRVLDLLDADDRPALAPKSARTFEYALAAVPGWMQGFPLWVEPNVADCVTAALVSTAGRTSNAWQRWLRTGEVVGRDG